MTAIAVLDCPSRESFAAAPKAAVIEHTRTTCIAPERKDTQ
ncbi:hypothetical protein IFM12276_33390 [Nocardia sputorum]|uniref:Uncharacterized protein n=1 Tax=Nocardia sputorum TaxID=2984338 RepID=A0ABM8CZ34_9NOCA|nr:hypothetical protein IFM12276_33390 [Nocardia sputorum]